MRSRWVRDGLLCDEEDLIYSSTLSALTHGDPTVACCGLSSRTHYRFIAAEGTRRDSQRSHSESQWSHWSPTQSQRSHSESQWSHWSPTQWSHSESQRSHWFNTSCPHYLL
ncbi:unnamed protein product [Arctogadus glacialis]